MYVAPSIGVSGLTIPTYADILQKLIDSKKEIYGSDIYLGVDSTDYQELSVYALMFYDAMQALQDAYNSRGPRTAVGTGLDGVIKINGLTRRAASYSTVDLTIYGTVGTTITNGVAEDTSGQKWDLPASVLIPSGGQVVVTATARESGSVEALIGTVTKINTPQTGWTSVTNFTAASAGTSTEQDSELRDRQEISTEIAASSLMDSLMGAVAAISGVSRSRGYENDTSSVDSNGIPANSVCIVVEGGDSTEIAEAISIKKTIGTGTFGDTTVEVYDYKGNPVSIDFQRASQIYINVLINIISGTGYSSAIAEKIRVAVASYIETLDIGDDVLVNKILAAASLFGEDDARYFNITSVEIGREGDSPSTAPSDITIDFDEVALTRENASPESIQIVVA